MKVMILKFLLLLMVPGLVSPGTVHMKLPIDDVGKSQARCEECKLILSGVHVLTSVLWLQLKIEGMFSSVCTTFLPLFGHNGTTICPELFELYSPDVTNIIFEEVLNSGCELLKICPVPDIKEEELQEIVPKTVLRSEKLTLMVQDTGTESHRKMKTAHQKGLGPMTFVQISDIHLDRAYSKNAATECGSTICCRYNISGQGSAGTYGNYHCDSTETTVRVLLDFIQNMSPPPSFFVYVGDSSPHLLLDTLDGKLEDNLLVNTLLVDKLRHIGPIFPVLGNHEVFPTNVYSRHTPNTQAILQSLSEQWPAMFDVTLEQLSNIRKHAFYTALVTPKLRILSINSLYDYLFNIYAFKAQLDPISRRQVQFMRQTLEDARRNNEKVIYISHMKPNPFQTYPSYTDEHNQLVTDFRDVIKLQLFGHEHCDAFLLNRDPANHDRVTGVSLAAPSITTYFSRTTGVNPSIRVYKLDPISLQPLDYDQYFVDVPAANEKGVAEVKKHYTFTEEYDVPDMSTSSFEVLSKRIHSNWTYFQKFEANYYVLAQDRPKCSDEDMLCQRQLTCQTRESKPFHFAACLLGQ